MERNMALRLYLLFQNSFSSCYLTLFNELLCIQENKYVPERCKEENKYLCTQPLT